MELNSVDALVDALVLTYAEGLQDYTNWQGRQRRCNHYRHQNQRQLSSSRGCGLSISLGTAGPKIKQLYDSGARSFGSAFSEGDARCRDSLQANLQQLQDALRAINRAAPVPPADHFHIFDAIRISEAVRLSTLHALGELHQRVAAGRSTPVVFLRDQPRGPSESVADPVVVSTTTVTSSYLDLSNDDAQTAYHTARDSRSFYLPEPPSPPPSPKAEQQEQRRRQQQQQQERRRQSVPDDVQSTCTSASGPRPKNSVFSTFCPEAMKYQVDLRKQLPTYRRCRCGYNFQQPRTTTAVLLPIRLKEGFLVTLRFLAKSHCRDGYGCVLCTSTGRTATYATAEALASHIDAEHDKWQMLHDRDMLGHQS